MTETVPVARRGERGSWDSLATPREIALDAFATLTPQLTLVLLVVLLGTWLQGSVGIGLGLFAAPLLALFAPAFVPGALLASVMVLGVLMAWRERHAISRPVIGWALLGRAPGAVIGAALVSLAAAAWLDLVLGGLILVCVGLSASRWNVEATRGHLIGAGLLSGITGTAASVGGPPMALVLQRQEGATVRATLSAYFLAGITMSLATLTAFGRFGREDLARALLLLPAILGGFFASRFTQGWIDRGRVRPAILTISGTAATWVLFRGLRVLF